MYDPLVYGVYFLLEWFQNQGSIIPLSHSIIYFIMKTEQIHNIDFLWGQSWSVFVSIRKGKHNQKTVVFMAHFYFPRCVFWCFTQYWQKINSRWKAALSSLKKFLLNFIIKRLYLEVLIPQSPLKSIIFKIDVRKRLAVKIYIFMPPWI